jgi:hypothetical protein
MDSKFSDTYRTSFLTLDRYLQQSNAAQFYFRPLLPPLNTVSGEFYSLSPAQGTDPSIRINKYSSNGTFLGFGYLYDTTFNVPPDTSGGGPVDVSGSYWTLTGSNIYNNNPGFVGIGNRAPLYPLDASGYGAETVINATTDSKKAIRITQVLSNADAPAEIYFQKYEQAGGAVGVDAEAGRGMFLYYNGEDRVSITPTGLVGIGTAPGLPTRTLDVSGNAHIHGPALSNLLFVGDASLNNPSAEQDTVKVGMTGKGGQLAIGDDGKGVLRMLNAYGDTFIEAGTNFTSGSTGRLVFASMFDASGAPTMTVNTGTDEVVISNRYVDAPVAGYKLTVDGSANVLGTVQSGHHYPQTSYMYDLGSSSQYWRDLYLSTGTIYMGPTATIGADGLGNVLLNKANGKGVGVGVSQPATSLEVSGQTTLSKDILYENRDANPLPTQLILRGQSSTNRFLLGSYYTGGVGTAASLQASDYYGGVDHGTSILLNPLGGNVGVGTPTPAVTLDVSGRIQASQAVASSLAVGSRINSSNVSIGSITSNQSFTANVSSLPYSVYLVTVEGSIDVNDSPGATAYCTININNNSDPQIIKEYITSCSSLLPTSISVGAPFTSTTPINKGTGTINIDITLSNSIFANPSTIYYNIIGLC